MAEDKTQDAQTVQPLPSPRGKDTPPSVKLDAFCRPHCGAYTHQYWYKLIAERKDKGSLPFVPTPNDLVRVEGLSDIDEEVRDQWRATYEKSQTGNVHFEKSRSTYSETEAHNLNLSKCYTCDKIAVWVHDRLVHPPQRSGPQPNEDLPGDTLQDYEEARSILSLSPRGAAALLRLCVEKLCTHLKEMGNPSTP